MVPAALVHGDSVRVRFELGGACVPPDWSLELTLIGPASAALSGAADGSGWIVTLSSANSPDDLPPGRYSWSARVSSALGGRHTFARGQLVVTPDPSDLASSDERSVARRLLEAVEAAMLQQGTTLSFSLFGRSYQFESRGDLLNYRNRLRAEVAAEEDDARLALGEPSQRTAWVRF